MNRKRLSWGFFSIGAALSCSVSAATLQFNNLASNSSLSGLVSNVTLRAVAYGGDTNFVAVGERQVYVCGNFVPGQPWLSSANWVSNQLPVDPNGPSGGVNLSAVNASENNFVAVGSNRVFSAQNIFTGTLPWVTNRNSFANSLLVPGLAYNNGKFVLVAAAPEIAWSGPDLSATNGWHLYSQSSFINPALSYLESFRGITPYGSNGFAVCGVSGDVRFSADGVNWSNSVAVGHIGEPDLNGIAYDGAHTFVCVGISNQTTGAILYSTNGTTWTQAITNHINPLNAIIYGGLGFIAVGDGGQVLTSSNGMTWTTVTDPSIPTNEDLYGVAFATSGYMRGIGELVGANGTVVLMGVQPPDPTNPVSITNCATYPNPPPGIPLTVTIVTNADFETNTVTVDWYDSQSNLVFVGSPSYVPTNNPNMIGANASTNYIYFARARDLRTGFVSPDWVPVTNTINPRPTMTLTTTNVLCNGEGTVLAGVLTGIGPWTVYWTDGFTNYTQTVNVNGNGPFVDTLTIPSADNPFNPTNSFFNQATNFNYWVTMVSDANCTSDPSDITGTDLVVVNPRPTSTSLTTNEISNGDLTALTNWLTGIGPWTVYWTNGSASYEQAVNVNSGGPYLNTLALPAGDLSLTNVNLNQAITNYYWVASLLSSNLDTHVCASWDGDIAGTNMIVIDPRPTSTLVTTNEICNGETTIITNVLTGVGPWTVYWTNGSASYEQAVNVNASGPYTNTLALPVGALTLTNENPNQAITNYYWVAAVVSSNNLDGHISTNWAGDLTGSDAVIIDPRPTSASVSTNEISNGDSTAVTNLLTGLGPWTVYWTDGTTSYTQAVNGVASGPYANVLPLPNSAFTVTNVNANQSVTNYYWVTAVISSNLDGHICTNWASDITGTNMIIIDPRPTSAAITTNLICNGDVTTVTNVLTGIGPWTVYWTDGFTNYTQEILANVAGPYTNLLMMPSGGNPFNPDDVIPDAATNHYYWVTQVVSSNSDGYASSSMAGDLTGTNLVKVDPLPPSAPTDLGDISACSGTTIPPLSVSIAPNFKALWFTVSNVWSSLVWTGADFPATNMALSVGTNVFYVAAQFDDPALTNACLSGFTPVTLILGSCTNPPAISLGGTNGTVEWFGNLTLQSTTNLAPANWMDVTNGAFGTNTWVWTNGIPPINFFRLKSN